jgi:SP family arabinose:H+ symporter-like MFS transporter
MNTNFNTEDNLVSEETIVNSGFITKVSIVAALGGLLFGFDTAIISGAIPYIKAYFSLNEYTLGWAVSSILIGCCAGALGAGIMADKFGRKTVLLICAVLFALSGLGAGFAANLQVFVSFRLVGGLGVGAAAMISPMYIAEIAPASQRGRLVSLYQLAIVTGILLAYLSNFALSGTGANNWRFMFMSQTLPALIFLIMLFAVPETPRWLIMKNQTDKAIHILKKTIGEKAGLIEVEQISKGLDKHKKGFFSNLSKRHLPVVYMGIIIAVFQQVTGINAILYYAPLIFKATGIGTASSLLQTISIGVINVITTFIAIGLVDRVGRKQFMLIGSFLMGLSLVTVALCFEFSFFKYYLVLIAILVYVASFGCTLGAVTWVYLSEIFPNSIRAFAMSVATLALWLADFVVTCTFPVLINRLGTPLTLLVYAACCAAAFIYVFIKVPETKGKTLEEIEHLLINKT